jgi:hypothetical protein
MTASKWQLSRIQYGFALGILLAVSIHFPTPKSLFAYACAGGITALRFRALDWKWPKAFIPFAMAAAGTMLVVVLGPQSKGGTGVAHLWRFAALVVQGGMTFRAVLSYAAIDPISRKQKLAREFLGKRRELRRTLNGNVPLMEAHRRESAKLTALLDERKAYIAAHGHDGSDALKSLIARFEAQRVIVQPLGAELRAATETLSKRGEEFRDAHAAWKNRNDKAA